MSFIFHAIFGLLMFEFGMMGVILIFIVDRILSIRKRKLFLFISTGLLSTVGHYWNSRLLYFYYRLIKNNKRDPIVRLYLTF